MPINVPETTKKAGLVRMDRYDAAIYMADHDPIPATQFVKMYQYLTYGHGFEQDNHFSRSSFFSELEKAGRILYGLSHDDSRDLANVFWFGGAGYISGWATPEAVHWTAQVCNYKYWYKYPTLGDWQDDRSCDPFTRSRIQISEMYMGMNDDYTPETYWFNPKRKILARSRAALDLLTGAVCYHTVGKYEEEYCIEWRRCTRDHKHGEEVCRPYCKKCGLRLNDPYQDNQTCTHIDKWFKKEAHNG